VGLPAPVTIATGGESAMSAFTWGTPRPFSDGSETGTFDQVMLRRLELQVVITR
jgi:hypothetical protein